MLLQDLSQSRLALFLVDADTGRPLRRIPVYAEAVLVEGVSAVRTDALTSRSLSVLSRENSPLAEAIRRAIAASVDLDQDPPPEPDVIEEIVRAVERALRDAGWEDVPYDARRMEATVADAVERMARELSLPVPPVLPPPATHRVPLGVLASDHAGFLSYDLRRVAFSVALPANRRERATVDFHVYPMLRDLGRFVVLDQGRVAPDAVVGKMELRQDPVTPFPDFALNLPALQNPGLIDWRLSPGSFAAVPQHLIGLDGCEALTPANFATSQFHMRQVVRLNETVPGANFPAAHVYEYAVSLIPIGHSLGQVQYSLPLAPGESVRLAVIDWRRADAVQRDEKTKLTESLLHDQTRDRTITETVKAAIDEWQRGGSVMGGLAGGAGASGQSGATSVVGGGMLSIGGAYATSSGSRDIAADTTQKITDAIHQASVSTREIQSTVVVQTDQQEAQNIQTRAFANHNRGHTMTVLYYEVLRHYRVVTEFTRRYRAALIPRTAWNLNDDVTLLNKRFVLQGALLEPGLAPAFDALMRADKARKERERNPPVPVVPFDEANIVFTQFMTRFLVGGGSEDSSPNAFELHVKLKSGQEITLTAAGSPNYNKDEKFNDSGADFYIISDPGATRWGDIANFRFVKASGDNELVLREIHIDGLSAQGTRSVHRHPMGSTYSLEDSEDPTDNHVTLAVVPPPPAPPVPPVPTLEQSLPLDDYALIRRLKDHVTSESAYYTRLLDLATHPNAYATRFETEAWAGVTMLIDAVAPTPLEVMGSRIGFPLLDQHDDERLAIPPMERLVSMPTRGIFAEAKLGHCNVAEEIDETRFWRWDEHPLPFIASEIAPVQPIQPKPAAPEATPSAFPAPVATIQAPVALPDPTGMAAVLKALTTPDIFRDMSAKAEVQKLLGDLIEGAVSMAQAANKAREIKSKMDTDLDKQQREQATAALQSNNDVRKAEIEAQREKAQQVTPAEAQHAIKTIDNQHAQGKIDTPTRNDKVNTVLDNTKGVGPPAPKPATPKAPPKPVAERTPTKGLVFQISFEHVGDRASLPVSGWAQVTVVSGVTGHASHFSRAQIFSSSLRLEAPEIAESGTILVVADYDWTTYKDVIEDALGKAYSGLKPKELVKQFASGAKPYTAPEKGNLVQITARPATKEVKKKATSGKEAATSVEAEGKADAGVASVGIKGTSGETTSVGSEEEWSVWVLTTGLVLEQVK